MTPTPAPANDNTPRPQWYDDLVRQYDPFLRNYCRTNFRQDDDLYQESQVVLLRTWRSYKEGKSIIPWMRYAVMTARKKMRKFKQEVSCTQVNGDGEEYSRVELGVTPANQDNVALGSIMLGRLTDGQQESVVGYLQGYTFEEIGELRGVQRQAAHGRFRSAMAKMVPANDNVPTTATTTTTRSRKIKASNAAS